jgi:hypothetical protein
MQYFLRLALLVCPTLLALAPLPSFGWDSPCYKGSLDLMPFPRENRTMITLEARRIVSVEGNLMTYDIGGGERVTIKLEGMACRDLLRDTQKGKCTAKGLTTIELEKKSFSDSTRYKATVPGPH